MKPQDFIALIGPAAQASRLQTGIPASFVVAQAALESGWGESGLAKRAMNLFGIKGWQINAPHVTMYPNHGW